MINIQCAVLLVEHSYISYTVQCAQAHQQLPLPNVTATSALVAGQTRSAMELYVQHGSRDYTNRLPPIEYREPIC